VEARIKPTVPHLCWLRVNYLSTEQTYVGYKHDLYYIIYRKKKLKHGRHARTDIASKYCLYLENSSEINQA
jgi:hypothetical protein